jgi:hypothetical protein
MAMALALALALAMAMALAKRNEANIHPIAPNGTRKRCTSCYDRA